MEFKLVIERMYDHMHACLTKHIFVLMLLLSVHAHCEEACIIRDFASKIGIEYDEVLFDRKSKYDYEDESIEVSRYDFFKKGTKIGFLDLSEGIVSFFTLQERQGKEAENSDNLLTMDHNAMSHMMPIQERIVGDRELRIIGAKSYPVTNTMKIRYQHEIEGIQCGIVLDGKIALGPETVLELSLAEGSTILFIYPDLKKYSGNENIDSSKAVMLALSEVKHMHAEFPDAPWMVKELLSVQKAYCYSKKEWCVNSISEFARKRELRLSWVIELLFLIDKDHNRIFLAIDCENGNVNCWYIY